MTFSHPREMRMTGRKSGRFESAVLITALLFLPGSILARDVQPPRLILQVTADALDKAPAIAALKAQFGIGEELIEAYNQP